MRDKAANIAKWAATLATKPWDAGEQVLHHAIDRVVGWLPPDQRSRYQKLLEEVTRQLEALPRDVLARDDLESALQLAEDLFAASGLTIDELVRRGLDGAIDAQRTRLDELLTQRGEGTAGAEAGICRQHIIPAVFNGLFADQDALAKIDLAFKDAVIKHLREIDQLPGQVAETLQRLAGRAMLVRPFGRWDPARQAPSTLLRAEYGSVEFEARDELVDEALAWCRTESDIGIRLYVGAGGMGKTRLMIELCRRLEAAEEGWCAGFLSERSGEVPDWLMPSPYRADEPMFVVVDYAETRDLGRLFQMANDWPKAGKLRIVLLARDAGEWWQTLPQLNAEAQALLPGPATRQEPTRIGEFTPDPAARRQLFDNAIEAFAGALDRDPTKTAPPPDLSQDDFRPILMIHLAAMAALDGETIGSAEDLLKDAINREVRLWEKGLTGGHLAKVGPEDVRQAMALLTLASGADSRPEAIELIGAARRLADKEHAVREDLVGWLARLYPSVAEAGDAARIEPLKPDLLGEVLVDGALQSWPELLPIALEAKPKPALTVLTRLAKHRQAAIKWLEQAFAHDLDSLAEPAIAVAIETGDPIGPVLARRLEEQELGDPSRLEPLIPEQTTALREVGVAVMQQMRARLHQEPQPWAEETKVEAARVANNLATMLRDVGRREAALDVAQEAVDLYRALADAFRPNLATSLSNLAAMLSDLGRREEALGAAQEAVDLYRALADARPDAFLPDLASSLHNLARSLSALGRREEALGAAQEAVELYRELAAARPNAFRPDLAASLNNLANRLSALGRREEALGPAEEAVSIQRELVAKAPGAFQPDLAVYLMAYANCLDRASRAETAIERNSEAIEVYTPCFLALPQAFAQRAIAMCQEYEQRCEKLGRKPDAELLAPILETLQQLQANEPEDRASAD